MFCDSNPWVFAVIDLNQHAFSVLKGVTPTFSNFGILLQIDIKICPLLGKLLSVWRTVSVLPKSALSAQPAQTQWRFVYIDVITLNLRKNSKYQENYLILLSSNEKRRKNWYIFRLDCFKAKFVLIKNKA